MGDVTKKQLERENDIQELAMSHKRGEMSENDANKKIVAVMKTSMHEGIFTTRDIKGFNHRRDKADDSKPRTPVKFILDMKRTHDDEHDTFLHFRDWCVKKYNREIGWRSVGSDIKGKVMIANFWQRHDCPAEPDYEIWRIDRPNHTLPIEVKNLGEEHWFKVYNLEKYASRGSYMVVRSRGLYYYYHKNTIPELLRVQKTEYRRKWGKDCIVVSKDGTNAHFSLEELIERKMVKIL